MKVKHDALKRGGNFVKDRKIRSESNMWSTAQG